MNQPLTTPNAHASMYVERMHSLGSEMRVAMEAIASNSLPRLQESIDRQQALCNELLFLANALAAPRSGDSGIEASIQEQIGVATRLLQTRSMEFSALLKHSGKSLDLLASLCKSYSGLMPSKSDSLSTPQTWSCEA